MTELYKVSSIYLNPRFEPPLAGGSTFVLEASTETESVTNEDAEKLTRIIGDLATR